jgi:hypothetical protein
MMLLDDSIILTGPNFFQEFLNDALVTPTGGVQVALADALANASGHPGGSNTQIQFNNNGVFGGISTTGTGNAVLATAPAIVGGTFTGTFAGTHTYSGAVTMSSAGTALSVTNNATVGGTLTTPTINSAASMVIAPASSANVINFKQTPSGTSIAQIGGTGGTSGNLAIQTQISLPGRTWSGSSVSANASLYQNAVWGGSAPDGTAVFLNLLQVTESIDAGTSGSLGVLYIQDTTSGNLWNGNRITTQFVNNIASAPAALNGGTHSALNTKCNGSVNVGGTSLAPGSAKGATFGINTVSHLGPSATFWSGCIGAEIDTWTEAGATFRDRIGLQIVDIDSGGGTSGVQGSSDDVSFSLNNQYHPSSTRGFKVGMSFGRIGGNFPVSTVGTMITASDLNGSFTVDQGIDFSLGTATTSWLNLGGVFTVDGSGNTVALTYKVGSNQVVGARNTGWTAMAGSTDKATAYNTGTVTLAQLAGRVAALQAALTTHGLIGT